MAAGLSRPDKRETRKLGVILRPASFWSARMSPTGPAPDAIPDPSGPTIPKPDAPESPLSPSPDSPQIPKPEIPETPFPAHLSLRPVSLRRQSQQCCRPFDELCWADHAQRLKPLLDDCQVSG